MTTESASGPSERDSTFWRRVTVSRTVIGIALCCAAPAFLHLSGFAAVGVFAIIPVLVLMNAVATSQVERRGLNALVLVVPDFFTAAACGILLPEVFGWALAVIVFAPMMVSIACSIKAGAVAIILTVPTYACIGWIQDATWWMPGLAVYTAIGGSAVWTVGYIAKSDLELRRRLEHSLTQFEAQARTDVLTGLENRGGFMQRLGDFADNAAQRHSAFSVLVMDLNDFKEVNDALGHHHGDLMLQELGRRLTALVPEGATAARLGGDEFAVVIESGPFGLEALTLANKIADAFREPISLDNIMVNTSVSVGVAVYPINGLTEETLLRKADAAMYRAKHQGTEVALSSTEQDSHAERELRLTGDISHAIERHEFNLEYQPRISISTNELLGVEALVRWNHPEFGRIGPADFIELAEASGAITELTQEVIRIGLNDLRSLVLRGSPIGLSINLSSRDLYDPRLVDGLNQALEINQLDPHLITFEVTESELLEDLGVARTVMNELRRIGSHISIDDFGTGYSSMLYLRDLPISQIKIDRSFIPGVERGDDVLVRTIVELGHNLSMDVVAEGVETLAQLEALRAIGCDSVQGFYLSHPLSFDDLCRFIDEREHHNVTVDSPQPLKA